MANTKKLTKLKTLKALELSNGMPTQTAKLLGVSYQAVYKYLKDNPELQEMKEIERAKLHEELESLTTFAIQNGYIQKSILDRNGKPTKEFIFEEVDVRTRLNMAMNLMNQYKGSVGIKEQIDITSKGEKINNQLISIIELPEALRPDIFNSNFK